MTLVRLRYSPNSRSKRFQEISGAQGSAVAERKAQMRDAGLEIILQAGHRVRQLVAIGCPHVVAQQSRQNRRGGLIADGGTGLELGPEVLGQVALPWRTAKRRCCTWRPAPRKTRELSRILPRNATARLARSTADGQRRRARPHPRARRIEGVRRLLHNIFDQDLV
jgi:hypothetical protein